MERIYNVLVYENYTTKLESIFNRFRIGLNNWDRTRVFEVQNKQVVNYTVVCTKDQYESIIEALKAV